MTAHPAEPPWYGPVCPVVWEGRRREAPPLSRSASTGPVRVGQDASQGGGPCVMSSWTAASSDCSRPMNNYVHVKTADLYRPNARLTRKDRDIRYLRHLENSDIAGFLGRERIQLFDEFRYFFVDRRQKRINAELVHASGSMFGDVLEFQKIRLR